MNTETPTPEQEMREIFSNTLRALSEMQDKVISAVVDRSRTHRELEAVRTELQDIRQRMTSVVDEAQRIRQDLHLVITERDKFKKDADDALAMAQGYEKDLVDTRQRLEEANNSVRQYGEELAQVKREKDQANALIERQRGDIEWVQKRNRSLQEERDQARKEAEENKRSLNEANTRLTKLQDTFRSIFPEAPREVKEEAKPVKLPGQAPSFQEVPHGYSYPVEQPSSVENVEPHPVQSAGEEQVSPVNERIDQPEEPLPWWKKDAANQ